MTSPVDHVRPSRRPHRAAIRDADGHAKVTGSARYAGEEAGPRHVPRRHGPVQHRQRPSQRRVRGADPRGAARYTNAAKRKILAASGMNCWLAKRGPKVSNLPSCAR